MPFSLASFTSINITRAAVLLIVIVFLVCSIEPGTDANLVVSIIDSSTDRKTPVRVKITDSASGAVTAPDDAVAVMYGPDDMAGGYALLPDSSFYANGFFSMDLKPGTYKIKISKGIEYLSQTDEFTLVEGQKNIRSYELKRWVNMPERGWYSADDHIHLRRSPRENPHILRWIAAEDIHVGNLLQMGDWWATYFSQYAFGEKGRYRRGGNILVAGQEEPRTPEIGHTISLGADGFARYRPDYYFYDKVFDRIHELNGITGYAHQGNMFFGYRGLTLDVFRNKIDFLELLQFCTNGGPLFYKYYYHFLDLGFKLTALAGSDFPWCGRAPRYGCAFEGPRIGNVRFYTYLGDELSFEKWMENVKAGHTFVSSGPIVSLTVNEKLPGDDLEVSQGSNISVSVKAEGHAEQVPLRVLEIVGHGKVLKRVETGQAGQSAALLKTEFSFQAERGIWIAARCSAGVAQIAHTTPVYVQTDGGGFHNPDTKDRYLALSEKYLQEIEELIRNPNSQLNNQFGQRWLPSVGSSELRRISYKSGLTERIREVRKILAQLKNDLE